MRVRVRVRVRDAPSPRGYMSLRNIAANIPGPGSGKTDWGWLSGSTDGLKASSAVTTSSAP